MTATHLTELKRPSLSEHDRCPKCGTRTLERDPEGDIHCWGCGTTFLTTVHPNLQPTMNLPKMPSPSSQPTNDSKQTSRPRVEPLEAVPRAKPITQRRDRHPSGAKSLGLARPELRVQPVSPTVRTHHPRGRLKGERVGHYGKTANKIDEVIRLYNDGESIRAITSQLNLAKNTARTIIQENSQKINFGLATRRRKERIKRTKQTIIPALKRVASSAKSNNYSYEVMFSHAEETLLSYLELNPSETIKSLIGDNPFTVDDVVKKAYEITLGQRLRLDDKFVEVEPGTFQLKSRL